MGGWSALAERPIATIAQLANAGRSPAGAEVRSVHRSFEPSEKKLLMSGATYKAAGVDLELYAEAMGRLPRLLHRTYSPRVIKADGGFAGLFRLDFDNRLFARNYQEPVLVSGTDGVGTKLKIAQDFAQHGTVGIDLVAMCVNDLLCTGAEPLFFLDYVALGRDDPNRLEQIVQGISDGCVQADCALLGGETAIMPDMYGADDYDLAGFAVGVVERARLLDGKLIDVGDVVIGLASSGLHSNGFSLVRKVLRDAKVDLRSAPDLLGEPVLDAVMRPTRIYVAAVRTVQQHYRVKQVLHGIAHITGGGLHENFSRILPSHVDAVIDRGSWQEPPVFGWLQSLGQIADDELTRVFNRGLGMVMVVSRFYAPRVLELLRQAKYQAWQVGEIVSGAGHSRWRGES
jgi:phosphoribosylformylglycinamidine cyclo-ligase